MKLKIKYLQLHTSKTEGGETAMFPFFHASYQEVPVLLSAFIFPFLFSVVPFVLLVCLLHVFALPYHTEEQWA